MPTRELDMVGSLNHDGKNLEVFSPFDNITTRTE